MSSRFRTRSRFEKGMRKNSTQTQMESLSLMNFSAMKGFECEMKMNAGVRERLSRGNQKKFV
ncbi:hypothetical protein COLO4_33884 [Corchorus olitorius]|uniref:Uncharacterized protein n=1 Tax=Corchorus olitorius TaxID=93759 RepID=A0A1R3GQA8_9ROSI|nr:hypothetical protein COLO4_33884 [Corchorus olitorius]